VSDPLPGWRLVWAEEFDDRELDAARWQAQLGNGFFHPPSGEFVPGWGNGELQYYTADPANVRLENSCLVIRALREPREGCDYTSARVRTLAASGAPLFAQCYGRFEVRARAPLGRGLWSAVWLLPAADTYGSCLRPASGEIDLMEIVGDRPQEYLGSLHFGAPFPERSHVTHAHGLPPGGGVQEFHVYGLEWEPGEIRWLCDGDVWATQRDWFSGRSSRADRHAWPAPFDQPFHLLVNLAVGGGLPGPPDESTKFPAELAVDYIRVYERAA
jgi:beta-glucanase (GH16 family)